MVSKTATDLQVPFGDETKGRQSPAAVHGGANVPVQECVAMTSVAVTGLADSSNRVDGNCNYNVAELHCGERDVAGVNFKGKRLLINLQSIRSNGNSQSRETNGADSASLQESAARAHGRLEYGFPKAGALYYCGDIDGGGGNTSVRRTVTLVAQHPPAVAENGLANGAAATKVPVVTAKSDFLDSDSTVSSGLQMPFVASGADQVWKGSNSNGECRDGARKSTYLQLLALEKASPQRVSQPPPISVSISPIPLFPSLSQPSLSPPPAATPAQASARIPINTHQLPRLR